MMSSPDPVRVGAPAPEVIEHWSPAAHDPRGRDRPGDQLVAPTGSVELGIDEEWIREMTGRQFDRAYDPEGAPTVRRDRGLAPTVAPGSARVTAPTLVVHGAVDPIVTVEGGEGPPRRSPGPTCS